MNRKLAVILFSLALLSLLPAACAPAAETQLPAETQQVRHFVGQVDGSNVFVGLAIKENRILAYVCDGTEETISVYAWFRGELSSNSFDLTSDNGLHLTGQLDSNNANGAVLFADGSEHAFAADLVEAPAGLYRQEENQIVSGWIVKANGEFRGGNRMSNGGSPGLIDMALVQSMGAQNFVTNP